MPKLTTFNKNFYIPLFLIASAFLFAAGIENTSAQQFVEGRDYVALDGKARVQKDGTVQVIEFFWYGCPACYRLEPYLETWKENKPETIDFVPIPAPLRDSWEFHARAHFAIESLGSGGKLEAEFFREIHENNNRMRTEDAFIEWAQMQPGVDAQMLAKSLYSFGTVTKLNQAYLLTEKYRVPGVPDLVVGGKYRTSPSMAGTEQRSLEIVEFLVSRILEES